jgi:hypothetical protein
MMPSRNQLLYILLVILPLIFLALNVVQTMKEVRSAPSRAAAMHFGGTHKNTTTNGPVLLENQLAYR